MKIELSIDTRWLFSNDAQHAGFIGRFLRETGSRWEGQISAVQSGTFDCQFEYNGNEPAASIAKDIRELISSAADTSFDPSVFRVQIADRGEKYVLNADGTLKTKEPSNDLLAQINALRKSGAVREDKRENGMQEKTPAAFGEDVSGAANENSSGQERSAEQKPEEKNSVKSVPETENREENRPADDEEKPGEPGKEYQGSAFDAIQDMVGNRDFKQLAGDIRKIAPQIIKNKTQRIFFSEVYLFSVDAGSGYHSSLRLLNDLLKEVGLFADTVKTDTITIPSFSDADMAGKMKNAVSTLETALEKQRLLTIDISDWIGHTHSKEFKKLVMQLFRTNSRCTVVFRIPYVKENVINATVKDLSDVIATRPVVFEPFSGDELREIARRYLSSNGYSFSENAWELFDNQINNEKADGFFYGIHTVHKLVGNIIRKQELVAATTGSEEKVIEEEVAAASGSKAEADESVNLETLNGMIGMQAITQRVIEIVNQIVYSRKSGLNSKPTMHMCFVGNPGTGKTTVARIIGQVLKERGVLRIGKFYEHHGRDFCAEYVGQTAPRTRAICQEAYGSVLFIDEAYSLATGGDRYDYGKEAIDTLVTEMENNSDDLIVIFAGYPDEIRKMISLNPGMRSRIPYTIEFPNYTRGQLADIFMGMAQKSFTCTDDLEASVRKFFDSIPNDVLNDKTFGNGRYVRNIFERTWGKAIARSSENGFDGITLTSQDFEEATKEYRYDNNGQAERKIGF